MQIMSINKLARQCGYFYNAFIEKDINVNNGYNCRHKKQQESECIDGEEIGKCYAWSCPLGCVPDMEDIKNPEIDNDGWEPESKDDIDQDDLIMVELGGELE